MSGAIPQKPNRWVEPLTINFTTGGATTFCDDDILYANSPMSSIEITVQGDNDAIFVKSVAPIVENRDFSPKDIDEDLDSPTSPENITIVEDQDSLPAHKVITIEYDNSSELPRANTIEAPTSEEVTFQNRYFSTSHFVIVEDVDLSKVATLMDENIPKIGDYVDINFPKTGILVSRHSSPPIRNIYIEHYIVDKSENSPDGFNIYVTERGNDGTFYRCYVDSKNPRKPKRKLRNETLMSKKPKNYYQKNIFHPPRVDEYNIF